MAHGKVGHSRTLLEQRPVISQPLHRRKLTIGGTSGVASQRVGVAQSVGNT